MVYLCPSYILTSYFESIRLFNPGVKFSSNSVKLLQRNYNIQKHNKVGMEIWMYAICEIGVWLCYVIIWEEFPKLWFSLPTLLPVCMLQYLYYGWTEYDEIFTTGVESPAGSKYDIRIDITNPQTRQPLTELWSWTINKRIWSRLANHGQENLNYHVQTCQPSVIHSEAQAIAQSKIKSQNEEWENCTNFQQLYMCYHWAKMIKYCPIHESRSLNCSIWGWQVWPFSRPFCELLCKLKE